MKIDAICCPICYDIIWSRAPHDFHNCSCGAVSIDGGFEYCKISWNSDKIKDPPKIEKIEIDVTKEEAYNDWNKRINKLGILKLFNL